MSEETVPAPAPVAASPRLPSFASILKETWTFYWRRFKSLYGVILLGILVTALILGLLGGAALALALVMPDSKLIAGAVFALIAVILVTYAALKYTLALIYVAETEDRKAKEAIGMAGPGVWSLGWINLLSGVLVLGGFLLFFVPGLILATWLFFAPFVFAAEGLKGMDSLMRSRQLVRGRTLRVFLYLFALNFALAVIGWIPVLGLVTLVLMPFSLVFSLVLYRHLAATCPADAPKPSRKPVVLLGTLGYVWVLTLALLFGALLAGAMRAVPWEKLRPGSGRSLSAPMPDVTMPMTKPPEPVADFTHEIILRNGHSLKAKVIKQDDRGVLVESGAGATTVFTHDEIARIAPIGDEQGGRS